MLEGRAVIPIAHPSLTVFLVPCGLSDFHAVRDFCDQALRRDWFVRSSQLRDMLRRPSTDVYAIVLDEEFVGLCVVHHKTLLHNLFLLPHLRGQGVGTAIMQSLKPQGVRCKSNMSSGNPMQFYRRLGYCVHATDVKRSHIKILRRVEPGEFAESSAVEPAPAQLCLWEARGGAVAREGAD